MEICWHITMEICWHITMEICRYPFSNKFLSRNPIVRIRLVRICLVRIRLVRIRLVRESSWISQEFYKLNQFRFFLAAHPNLLRKLLHFRLGDLCPRFGFRFFANETAQCIFHIFYNVERDCIASLAHFVQEFVVQCGALGDECANPRVLQHSHGHVGGSRVVIDDAAQHIWLSSRCGQIGH